MFEFYVRRLKWFCVFLLAARIAHRQAYPNASQVVSNDALLSFVFLTLILVLLHELLKAKGIRFGPLRVAGMIVFGLGVINFAFFFALSVFGGG